MDKPKDTNVDAVAMMRQIRDRLGLKLMSMTHDEQQRYIEEKLAGKIIDEEASPRQRSSV